MALGNFTMVNQQLEQLLQQNPWILGVLVVIMIWKLIWYGIAIYKSVEKKQKAWFVVLFVSAFVLNDLGLLAILYIIFNRYKNPQAKQKKKR